MGLSKPNITTSKPFSDQFQEGERFVLDGIRIVDAKTEYGDGKMVVLQIRGYSDEFSIWGTYLTKQAESVEDDDLGRQYHLTTGIVEGFSKRPVKRLVPYAPTADDDIPF